MKYISVLLLLLSFHIANSQEKNIYEAPYSSQKIIIDGLPNDSVWDTCEWDDIDQLWLGSPVSPDDFTGKYKLAWTDSFIYVLAMITDDVLHDHYPDPTDSYWKDDCLEVFIDEDASGGDHKYNYNAFAYHISTTYDVVDLGLNGKKRLLNDHIEVIKTKDGNTYTWELKITLYTDEFKFGEPNNPVSLPFADKEIGFSIAYCDNDGGDDRESFIGSQEISSSDKNTSWKQADDFGLLILKKEGTTSIHSPFELFSHEINTDCEIYPNPAYNNSFNISLNNSTSGNIIFDLYTYNGQFIKSIQHCKDDINLNVGFTTPNLQPGYYLLKIRSEKQEIDTRKIIIR
jgi:hypothetical protein